MLGTSFAYSTLQSIVPFTAVYHCFTYKPLKNQMSKWLTPINCCLYCFSQVKRASGECFKHSPALSICGVTLIASDWCPVPIFVPLRIVFPFLLVLSRVLGFSFIHCCAQVTPIPSVSSAGASCIASWFRGAQQLLSSLLVTWTQLFTQYYCLLCVDPFYTLWTETACCFVSSRHTITLICPAAFHWAVSPLHPLVLTL